MPLFVNQIAPTATWVLGDARRTSHALRLAIVSEGYMASEMAAFRAQAQEVFRILRDLPPFSRFRDDLAFVRIDCLSLRSATALQPGTQPPADYLGQTAFDVIFDPDIPRGLRWNDANVEAVLRALPSLPRFDAVLGIVNNPNHGGAASGAGRFTFATAEPGLWAVAVHELGHAAFGLADEYEELTGRPGEPVRVAGDATEPAEPNVTAQRLRARIPWTDLIIPEMPLPTTVDNPSAQCTRNKPVRAVGAAVLAKLDGPFIGLFEGAAYVSCGRFRPAPTCRMRSNADEFCAVCAREISHELNFRPMQAHLTPDVAPSPMTHMVALPEPGTFGQRLARVLGYSPAGLLRLQALGEWAEQPELPLPQPRDMAVASGFDLAVALPTLTEAALLLGSLWTGRRQVIGFGGGLAELGDVPPVSPTIVHDTTDAARIGFAQLLSYTGSSNFLLSYRNADGFMVLEDSGQGAVPAFTRRAATEDKTLPPWRLGLNAMATLDIEGRPYAVGVARQARTVHIVQLPDPDLGMAWRDSFDSPAGFAPADITHVGAFGLLQHGPRIVLHSALTGTISFYRPRRGGAGLDHLFTQRLPPGTAALLDRGLPAMGVASGALAGSVVDRFWLYNAALGSFWGLRIA